MGCNKPHKKSNDFRPVWIAPTEKFVYKISTYIHLCRNWKPIITLANRIKRFMTFDKYLNSVDICAKSNHWYFRFQPPAYPCSIKTEATTRTKRWSSFVSSRKVIKFVYLRKNSNITVLNMGHELDLHQLTQELFWHYTYSRSETSNAW